MEAKARQFKRRQVAYLSLFRLDGGQDSLRAPRVKRGLRTPIL